MGATAKQRFRGLSGPGRPPRCFASTGETMSEACQRLGVTEVALRWRLRNWGEEAALNTQKHQTSGPKVIALFGTEPRYIPTLPAVKKRVTCRTNGRSEEHTSELQSPCKL